MVNSKTQQPSRTLLEFYEPVRNSTGVFQMLCADAEGQFVLLDIPQDRVPLLISALNKCIDDPSK